MRVNPARDHEDNGPRGVLIVEDDPTFSRVLRIFLDGEEELYVVDNVGTAEEAFAHPLLDAVDLVLIDIGLPGVDGIEATKRLHEINPELHVIVMSGRGFELVARQAVEAGAAAFLEKGALHETLVHTLLSVGRRGRIVQHAA
ncbi:MAG: two-component system, NarL family, response regulator EvgA [Gaiellaceae bacterium]|jgi:DNA-binding NarL/FixJ family response regulator|nr:two-component system, NarL family, response regulator EvgA [Gaiellaceae bacterium]